MIKNIWFGLLASLIAVTVASMPAAAQQQPVSRRTRALLATATTSSRASFGASSWYSSTSRSWRRQRSTIRRCRIRRPSTSRR
jgi:hypothetical protein